MSQIDITTLVSVLALFGTGGVVAFATKQHIDAKNETIQGLKDKITDLEGEIASDQTKHEQEKERLESKILDLNDLIQTLRKNPNLSSLEVEKLLSISTDVKGWESAINASSFVKIQRIKWLEEAVSAAQHEYSEHIHDSQVEKFRIEIDRCIDWLQESLQEGYLKEIDAPLKSRSIQLIFPYRAALKHIAYTEDLKQLEEIEEDFIREYTLYLLENL